MESLHRVEVIFPHDGGKPLFHIRCLNFLEYADAGEIAIGDSKATIPKAKKKELNSLGKKTGFVFQGYNLFANMTALGNVMEGLVTGRKIPKKEAEKIATETLDWVGLSDRYNYYPL